eukprot:GILI01038386.1.p1 GENE.GILI01038386.1~~GILI01038386.1.p1  ORF type:complete len:242 (+),score=57.37 GILI01038386.1:34-759(+)
MMSTSTVQANFEGYRRTYDGRTERRENIIKASRDITAEGKKATFQFHRVVGAADVPAVLEEGRVLLQKVGRHFDKIAVELKQGEMVDYWLFQRFISMGVQEYVESLIFYFYLKDNRLVSLPEVQEFVRLSMTQPAIVVTPLDYFLGICDFTGEVMRYAINIVSKGQADQLRHIADFLGSLFSSCSSLPISITNDGEVRKKLVTMEQSLAKVERACYNLALRGSEYPPEMLARMLAADDDQQ